MHDARIAWLDRAKGICIILVVGGHVLRGLVSAHLIPNEKVFQWSDSVLYGFHMPAFFFLAGMTFFRSYERSGWKPVALNALRTILYPLVIWSLIEGAIHVCAGRYVNNPSSWGDITRFAIQPFGQLWFLYTLFLMYFLDLGLLETRRTHFQAALLIVGGCLYFTSPRLPGTLPLNLFSNLIFFNLGAVAAAFGLFRIGGQLSWNVLGSSLAIFVIFALMRGNTHEAPGGLLANLVTAISGISLVILLAGSNRPIAVQPLLEQLGLYSLEIYLMHIIFASGARVVLARLLGITSPTVHVFAGLLAGIGIPLVCAMWLRTHEIAWPFRLGAARQVRHA